MDTNKIKIGAFILGGIGSFAFFGLLTLIVTLALAPELMLASLVKIALLIGVPWFIFGVGLYFMIVSSMQMDANDEMIQELIDENRDLKSKQE